MVSIKVKLLRPEAVPPTRQTELAAGMDLHACIDQAITLKPMERQMVGTGIAIELPAEFEAQIRARSGLAIKHGVCLANGVGTIDADFRDEIKILLINLGQEDFTITPGMRVAQMVVARYESVQWEVADFLSLTDRDTGGFGSTGLGGQAA